MAPPRSYNYELLKQLVRDHPDWSYHEYAKVLTEHERTERRDPKYAAIMPNAIAQAISRYRDRWADEGLTVPDRGVPVYSELIPWKRIPEQHKMHVYLRKLRTLARHRRGEQVDSPRELRQALQFERDLRERKQVVDLGPQGRPLLRPAAPHELDNGGNLIDIVARSRNTTAADLGVRSGT